MAKGFCIGGSDFDTLFEASYTNFNTVTFSNLSPTCKYCTRYFGDNPNSKYSYGNNRTLFDASPRGFLPSNYKVATVTTTGRWMKIQRESTGFSVNGTTYRNSNRGSYPINRVGLVFCGGGAGGDGGGAFVEMDGDVGFYANWSCGNGGGGGGTVAVTLWLDKYTYYLYLGRGGRGGSESTTSSSGGGLGNNGGASYLRLTSSSGTLLATANGGIRGSSGEQATGVINNSSYTTTVGTAKGAYGGTGGYCDDMYLNTDMGYGYADGVGNFSGSSNSGTLSGYFSQQVSGARINQTIGGVSDYYSWDAPDGNQYQMGPGCEGRSAMDTVAGCGGRGGDAGYNQGSWSTEAYAYAGGDGNDARAFFYY